MDVFIVLQVMRMNLDSLQVVCEAVWESQRYRKLGIDPVHGYAEKLCYCSISDVFGTIV